MPKDFRIDHGELMSMYQDSLSANRRLFNEQRANIQLFAGDHYAALKQVLNSAERDGKVSSDQRIRLTENHIQRIDKRYINLMMDAVPGVGVYPYNKTEQQDIKAAEIHGSIWEDVSERHDLESQAMSWAWNYVVPGECFVKTQWDPSLSFQAWEDELDKDGEPTGRQVPLYDGDFLLEQMPSYDVLTAPAPVKWEKCPWLIYRKLVNIKELQARFPDKKGIISSGTEEEFKIWNTVTHQFEFARSDLVRIFEAFFRPSNRFPEGYFAFFTLGGTLAEGDLPLGIFPIDKVGWDDIEQSPRSRSINKQLRPVQGEINRMASKITEHQITLGDDKLVTFDGARVTQGASRPGIRHYRVNGQVQQVIAGRTGDQYIPHLDQKVGTLYQIAMLEEAEKQKESTNQDPWAMLYRSVKEKKVFSLYDQKFLKFTKKIAQKVLRFAKYYYEDDRMVMVAGRNEQVNIAEFKSSDPISTQIKVKEQSADLDTMFGKQLAIQHLMQFIGPTLMQKNPDAVGPIMKAMPFLNDEEIFTDVTLDHDNIQNDILALDRGEPRPPQEYDNHSFVIKRLVRRMKQPDFAFMNDQIKAMYSQKVQAHSLFMQRQREALERSQAGFIPMSGGTVAVNMSAPDPETGKNKRIHVPAAAVTWLLKKLSEQGVQAREFLQLPPATLADIQARGKQEGQGAQPAQMRPAQAAAS